MKLECVPSLNNLPRIWRKTLHKVPKRQKCTTCWTIVANAANGEGILKREKDRASFESSVPFRVLLMPPTPKCLKFQYAELCSQTLRSSTRVKVVPECGFLSDKQFVLNWMFMFILYSSFALYICIQCFCCLCLLM